jgi:hypothetical protein
MADIGDLPRPVVAPGSSPLSIPFTILFQAFGRAALTNAGGVAGGATRAILGRELDVLGMPAAFRDAVGARTELALGRGLRKALH